MSLDTLAAFRTLENARMGAALAGAVTETVRAAFDRNSATN